MNRQGDIHITDIVQSEVGMTLEVLGEMYRYCKTS